MQKLFLVLLALFFLACNSRQKEPPYLLPGNKMRDILIDIHLAEGKVALLNMAEDSSKVLFNSMSEKIFRKYKTNSVAFHKSYDYYTKEKGQELEKIYTSVVDSLSMREARKRVN